jgi:hypothetical protein
VASLPGASIRCVPDKDANWGWILLAEMEMIGPMALARRAVVVAVVVALAAAAAPARAADPVLAAAGDIACGPAETGVFPCQQVATAGLVVGMGAAAVLALGDNQYNSGSLADFNAFYNASWGRVKSITHPVIGNHEYGGGSGGAGYFGYFGKAAGPSPGGYYSFDVGTWHVVALNSNCDLVPGGCGVGSPQEQWLRADLKAHQAKCTLAFEHHPLWATVTFEEPRVRPLFQALYDADAELFLTGHDHLYERFDPSSPDQRADNARGIQQFIVGTGGRDLSGLGPLNPNSAVRDNGTFGVLKLTLHPTSYDWQFVPAGGGFTDAGTRACHGQGAPPIVAPAPPPAPPAPAPGGPSSLVPNAPALSPEDIEYAKVSTRVNVSSARISRSRVTLRGRLTTGASAARLRLTLSRKRGNRTIRVKALASGGRAGAWKTVVKLPRSLRGVKKFRVALSYLGETGYLPAKARVTVRDQHFTSR